MNETRLQKFLAQAGIASRRKAEELINEGRVKVNGNVIKEMGVKVTAKDIVKVDGKKVEVASKKTYVMLHKPDGYVTTVKDQFERPTVIDLLKDIEERLYPVGRLDCSTSGLLLLTNDGDFTFKITHPKHEMEKVYIAKIKGTPTREDIEQFENGIIIEGVKTAPAKLQIVKINEVNSIVKVTIHEGKNRQIRKMFDSINHTVLTLKRIAVGNLELGDLPMGEWRLLSKEEVNGLLK